MKAHELRKGNVILHNKTPYRVMEYQHTAPGKGRAVVQTKLRNLLNGNQTEVRFGSTEKVEMADVIQENAAYLYADADGFNFMNNSTYEQVSIPEKVMASAKYYLQDNMQVQITLFEGNPIGIELPATVTLTIVETEPELKGATATNSPKPATTDTGLQLSVPNFIKQGEKIIVNTSDGSYASRAS